MPKNENEPASPLRESDSRALVEAMMLLGELVRRISYRMKRSMHQIEVDELHDVVERELRNVKQLLGQS